jgi:hypothetical protein
MQQPFILPPLVHIFHSNAALHLSGHPKYIRRKAGNNYVCFIPKTFSDMY